MRSLYKLLDSFPDFSSKMSDYTKSNQMDLNFFSFVILMMVNVLQTQKFMKFMAYALLLKQFKMFAIHMVKIERILILTTSACYVKCIKIINS
jgi:hypothetical protein